MEYEHSDGLVTGWYRQLYLFGGVFLLGALPGYVSARYRLLTPVPVVVGLYAMSLSESIPYIMEREQAQGTVLISTIFDLVVGFWFLVLAGALVVGAAEYGVRQLYADM